MKTKVQAEREKFIGAQLDARRDLELTFAGAALGGTIEGTVDARDIAALVSPDMLYDPKLSAIWRACVELAESGARPHLDTIFAYIHERQVNGNLSPVSWASGVTALDVANLAISIFRTSEDAIWHYTRLMRREALKRESEPKLLGLASDCIVYGSETFPIAEGLRAVADRLEDANPREAGTMASLMEKVVASARDGEGTPLPTPWPNLNAVLKGGIAKGELAILAARPGMGKTALATCFAVETARRGVPVLFISREVKDLTLGQRIIAREARIDSAFFRQGVDQLDNLMPAIEFAADNLAPLPLRILEKSVAPMTPSEIRRLVRSTSGCGLVVIDYLQLLTPDTQQINREREVAEMSRSMKRLALDCDCPVLLLSQLNRNVEESGREPRLSDLRESGAIEQDADIVIFLHAEKADAKLQKMPARAIVAKGRSSGTGSACFVFEKKFADFRQVAEFSGNEYSRSGSWRENEF